MARLTITAHARADLQEIHSYIAKDNPEAARRFVEKLREKARQLAETPGMGRSRGEDLRPDLLSFPVGQYVLFYHEQLDGIVLVRVIHGSRDLPALLRLAMMRDGRGFQINTHIVTAFDLWFPKDERQRVLWPSTVRLSHEYFESLRKHAVPLDERALAALAHSAMARDVYSWCIRSGRSSSRGRRSRRNSDSAMDGWTTSSADSACRYRQCSLNTGPPASSLMITA